MCQDCHQKGMKSRVCYISCTGNETDFYITLQDVAVREVRFEERTGRHAKEEIDQTKCVTMENTNFIPEKKMTCPQGCVEIIDN